MEKIKYKISIIVPIYNSANYLEKCVNSILNQTHKNIEVVLVNDGSTDNSEKICQSFRAKDNRIICLNKNNGGLSSARNMGLNSATGDFIVFVDSDDYIEKNMIEELLKSALITKADVSVCSFFMEDENGKKCAESPNLEESTYSTKQALELLASERQDCFVIACNKLYRKHVINNVRFPENRLHEDQFVAHRIFFNAGIVSTIPAKLYHYVIRENSLSHRKNPIKHLDDIDALFERIEFYKQNNLEEIITSVEQTMFNVFKFYKQKFKVYGKLTKQEIKKIKRYASECYKFFKQCLQKREFSREEIKARKQVYKISLIDVIRFKYGDKLKSNRLFTKIYNRLKRRENG